MAFDPRQVVAAFLTFSMFAMLGNMIKQDHIDPYLQGQVSIQSSGSLMKLEKHASGTLSKVTNQGLWMEKSSKLKPCWKRPAPKGDKPKGYITFSLTIGPEYHLSQITDAVVIARYLGATLVLPDIRGSELGHKRNFEDVYDVDKFIKSLDGVINIVKTLPTEVAAGRPAVVRVPNRVSEDFIAKNIEPIFRTKNYLRLAIVFPSINLRIKEKQSDDLDSTSCQAMFGSLELKPEIQRVADAVVERLRTLSHNKDGRFAAVDLRIDVLDTKSCKERDNNGRKSCYTVEEVIDLLNKIGFDGDTTIYLTETWWHDSLNLLKQKFPKTYTKDDVVPADKKSEFLKSGSNELERALDFHVCSESDVFVPALSDLFYGHVAGKRIASGKTQIISPSQLQSSSSGAVSDFVSSYVSEKNHLAYSCFCEG